MLIGLSKAMLGPKPAPLQCTADLANFLKENRCVTGNGLSELSLQSCARRPGMFALDNKEHVRLLSHDPPDVDFISCGRESVP